MRLAVFSDVHGNLAGLKAVLAEINKERPDRLVFCGDLCGYYYRQNEVAALLSGLPKLTCVRGNHDQMFLDARRDPELRKSYARRYGRSYELLHERAAPDTIRFLESLPKETVIAEAGAAVFHGSPWNPLDEYVYPTDPVERFAALPHRFVLLGHTHHPMHKKSGSVHVVNPGSCGQPRDHNLASFALVDTETSKVELRRAAYDVDSVLAEVKANDPGLPYLSEVLGRRPK